MADIYAKHRSASFEELVEIVNDEFKGLNEAERVVYDALVNETVMDSILPDFFKDSSVDKLNKHFGAHDDVVVTENLRAALDGVRVLDQWWVDMAEMFPNLPKE